MTIASALLLAAMFASALWVGAALPADARLPIHWNAAGLADRHADKWTALLMLPATAGATALLFFFLPALEPRARGLARSQGLYLAGWAGTLIVLGLAHVAVLAAAFGADLAVPRLLMAGIGLLFLLIGNQLGKSRSMYMVGIRTPWTLASEEVWIRTHRLGGRLMVAMGFVLVLIAAFDVALSVAVPVMLVGVALIVLVPVIYSFLLWRGEKVRTAENAQSSANRSTDE